MSRGMRRAICGKGGGRVAGDEEDVLRVRRRACSG